VSFVSLWFVLVVRWHCILEYISLILCITLACPMPIVLAFAFDAVTAARLEVEY